ncbi:hypothetical protein BG000_008454 [Podila horticola]|nr:hypothetical protein BG000_008454 [Podila horticola]
MASRTSPDQHPFAQYRLCTSIPDNGGRDEAWVRSIIGKNARYIRRLHIRWPLTLEACVQSGECVNVTVLETSILPDGNRADEAFLFTDQWEQFVPDVPASYFVTKNNPEGTLEEWYHPFISRALRFMWQFILQNPGLEELAIGLLHATEGLSYMPPKPFLYNTLKSLTRLRRLENLHLDNDDFALLPTLTPKLERFCPGRCSLIFTQYYGDSVMEMGIGALKSVYTHMKVVKFRTMISAKNQAKILECMPGLTELHVGREISGNETANWNEKLHINADTLRLWSVPHLYCLLHPTITHSTKNLQELRIQMVNYGVNGLVELLRRVNPDLRVLDTDCFVSYPIESWYTGIALPLPPQVLDVQGTLPQFNLRSLRLSGLCTPHILFTPARHGYEQIVEQSEELTAGSAWWGCLPHLTEFVAQFVAPATLIGIADNCPQIEILDVSLAQKGSDAIAYVLMKCAKLKSFVGKGHMVYATQVVEGPAWVCRDIERLHLEVQGIPRNGGVTDNQGQGTGEESLVLDLSKARELSIGVYELIGQLTKLWELDLGGYTHLPDSLEHTRAGCFRSFEMTFEVVDRVHPFLNNSLELSLASGLDRLAGLRNLRRIGVQEVDLSIGQEELDWMKEHWPRLESWMGLEAYLNNTGDYSAKNGQIAKLIKETWPSVRLDDWGGSVVDRVLN